MRIIQLGVLFDLCLKERCWYFMQDLIIVASLASLESLDCFFVNWVLLKFTTIASIWGGSITKLYFSDRINVKPFPTIAISPKRHPPIAISPKIHSPINSHLPQNTFPQWPFSPNLIDWLTSVKHR